MKSIFVDVKTVKIFNDMYFAGHIDREIAEKIFCTYGAVQQYRKRMGLPANGGRNAKK